MVSNDTLSSSFFVSCRTYCRSSELFPSACVTVSAGSNKLREPDDTCGVGNAGIFIGLPVLDSHFFIFLLIGELWPYVNNIQVIAAIGLQHQRVMLCFNRNNGTLRKCIRL